MSGGDGNPHNPATPEKQTVYQEDEAGWGGREDDGDLQQVNIYPKASPFDEPILNNRFKVPLRLFVYFVVGAVIAYPLITYTRGYNAALGALVILFTIAVGATPTKSQPPETRLLYGAHYYLRKLRPKNLFKNQKQT